MLSVIRINLIIRITNNIIEKIISRDTFDHFFTQSIRQILNITVIFRINNKDAFIIPGKSHSYFIKTYGFAIYVLFFIPHTILPPMVANVYLTVTFILP